MSKAAAKLHKIGAAGLKRRYPASNPLPYIEQITVRATKVPPCGKEPRAKEMIKETRKIQITSKKANPRLE